MEARSAPIDPRKVYLARGTPGQLKVFHELVDHRDAVLLALGGLQDARHGHARHQSSQSGRKKRTDTDPKMGKSPMIDRKSVV